MLWDSILVSFGALLGEIYHIGEKCVFDQRFSMQERHGNELKIRVIFDMRFASDFWSEISQKWYQNGSQTEENPIKNYIKKSMRFWTPKDACGGKVGRTFAGRWGGRGGTVIK